MKKTALKVRNAGFQDAKAIYLLIKEHPQEVLARSISDIIQNIDRFLVCTADGRVVGTVSWQILPEIAKSSSPSIEIKSLAVTKAFQGRGVGSALVRAVIRRIRAFQPAQIVVLTFSPKFFARFGFKAVPKESLMHKLYLGCVNCTKYDSPFTCPEQAMALAVSGPDRGAD